MVWPHDEVDGDENSESIELAVSYGRGRATLSALLTGDAEQDELGRILSAGDVADIDLLKVGHHGSKVSLTYEQACALAPELAVASAGEGNDYGHPSSECVEVLQRAGAVFLCTKDVGDVDVRPGSSGLRVIARSRRLDDLS
jgi:competence protein ComEC